MSAHHGSLARELALLVERLDAVYADLEVSVESHRTAIRAADVPGMALQVERQQGLLATLAGLDQDRLELVERARREALVAPHARPRLRDLAALLPEPDRSRTMERTSVLGDRMARVNEAQAGLRAAAGSLLAHMEGLVRHVARKLSHAGTYGRTGVVEGSPIGASAVDIRT